MVSDDFEKITTHFVSLLVSIKSTVVSKAKGGLPSFCINSALTLMGEILTQTNKPVAILHENKSSIVLSIVSDDDNSFCLC